MEFVPCVQDTLKIRVLHRKISHNGTLDGTKILCEAWDGNTLIPLYDNEDGVSAALNGGNLAQIAIGAAAGAIGGVLLASGVGIVGQVVGSAALAMASNAATQVVDIVNDETGETHFDIGDMLFDGAVAAITAGFSGPGASYGNTAGINASWKQLCKRGISNPKARQYFYKTAHNAKKKFVLTAVFEASGWNTAGSAVMFIKNKLKGVFE